MTNDHRCHRWDSEAKDGGAMNSGRHHPGLERFMGVIVDVLIVLVAIPVSNLLCWKDQHLGKKAKTGRP